MSKEQLTVEIFRDRDRKDISTEIAEDGIDQIRRLTTGIAIVRTSRLLKIANSEDTEEIDTDKIRWPKLDADFNIVLTNRTINIAGNGDDIGDEHGAAHGVSLSSAGSRKLRVALVDVKGVSAPNLVVAHETAHMLGVKKEGDKWDGYSHCTDDGCLMYPSLEETPQLVHVKRQGFANWMERNRFYVPEYTVQNVPSVDEFCGECSELVDKKAYYFKQAKSGISMFENLL